MEAQLTMASLKLYLFGPYAALLLMSKPWKFSSHATDTLSTCKNTTQHAKEVVNKQNSIVLEAVVGEESCQFQHMRCVSH